MGKEKFTNIRMGRDSKGNVMTWRCSILGSGYVDRSAPIELTRTLPDGTRQIMIDTKWEDIN